MLSYDSIIPHPNAPPKARAIDGESPCRMTYSRNAKVPCDLKWPCPISALRCSHDFRKYPMSCPFIFCVMSLKPRAHVSCNLLAIDLRLDVRNDCDGLEQKFQHAEYFTSDPLIIFKRFSLLFSMIVHTT